MLLDDYSKNGNFHNANFVGALAKGAGYVYRGDLVLRGDLGLPANERTPPKELMTQVVLVATETELTCVVGALDHLSQVESLFATYGSVLAPKCRVVLFARDVPKPLATTYRDVPLFLYPNDDTLVWNELLDALYIEKDDIKKLSPEQKVGFVGKTIADFKPSFPTVSWDEALARRVERKPLDRVGAV